MNKLKLTLSILALTVSQITMADYVMKIPLEVSNGGTLPNGSIKFVTVAPAVEPVLPPAVEPVLPPVVDCVEVGVSTDCDERLGAWEKFAKDNRLDNNWNSLFWEYENLTNIPSGPYPTTHVDILDLSGNKLTNVDWLSNITSAGRIDFRNNGLENVNGLSNLKTVDYILLDGNYLTDVNVFLGLTSVVNLYLQSNRLTDVDGLSNITSAGSIDLSGNNLTNLNGLANIAISDSIYIDSYYSGPKLPASSRFCLETPMDRFLPQYEELAIKSQVCETP